MLRTGNLQRPFQEENISSFKHDECNRETATTNHIMVNRNQST